MQIENWVNCTLITNRRYCVRADLRWWDQLSRVGSNITQWLLSPFAILKKITSWRRWMAKFCQEQKKKVHLKSCLDTKRIKYCDITKQSNHCRTHHILCGHHFFPDCPTQLCASRIQNKDFSASFDRCSCGHKNRTPTLTYSAGWNSGRGCVLGRSK